MAKEENNRVPVCGCKGIRSCLICEKLKGKRMQDNENSNLRKFIYEPTLGLAVSDEQGVRDSFPFPGVFLWNDFVSPEEERHLVETMDQDYWKESQSGRRKQDFGPKVNFKKQHVRLGGFTGLPPFSRDLVTRMREEPLLQDFEPVEQCNLDYNAARGSAIDPHFDDSWLWGERLVTINLLSDTVVTMSRDEGDVLVSIGLPRRSLLVLYSKARHQWKHAIHRKDIHERRVCSTYRELSPEFLPGGLQEKLGSQLLSLALTFRGVPV
ncbi:alpha-ketoglutarate-dependent dioxygenase alkB 4-like [Arapaima gigas]